MTKQVFTAELQRLASEGDYQAVLARSAEHLKSVLRLCNDAEALAIERLLEDATFGTVTQPAGRRREAA